MEWRLNHVGQMAQSVQDYSAGSYKGRLVAKRLGYKGKKRNLFIATYGIKGAVVGAIIGAFAGYGIGCYGSIIK